MILRIGKPQWRIRLFLAPVCRLAGHRPDEARLHRLRIGNVTTHRYLVTRCGRCTRLLSAERIGRKTGHVKRIEVRKKP